MTEPISGAGIVASVGSKAVSELNKAGAFEKPIKILNEILYITIGHRTELKAQKLELMNKLNFQKFSEDLEVKVSKISEEDIQEPPINIAGPAIEASKFHMGEDQIREMFAQLVASSMNKSQDSNIHPSFVEIIKMLSPDDAINLRHLFKQGPELPIVNIKAVFSHDSSYFIECNHVLFMCDNDRELHRQTLSIDNLIRLKLADVTYIYHLTNADLYKKYEQLPLYIELKNNYEKECLKFDSNLVDLDDKSNPQYGQMSEEQKAIVKEKIAKARRRVEIGKGVINLTAFGSAFCKVCL